MDSPYNYDNLFTVLGEELQITANMNEIIEYYLCYVHISQCIIVI